VHARSGVSCADCHMPYERQGAMKVSSHWVRSPLLNINRACQTCHNVPEAELRDKVETIQNRTKSMRERAAVAMTDMLDAILEAKAAGAKPDQLAPIFELQKKAMWRLDFISSENSDGFHADQEAVRVLGESIDYSRQAQAAALRLRAPAAPPLKQQEGKPVEGVADLTGLSERDPTSAYLLAIMMFSLAGIPPLHALARPHRPGGSRSPQRGDSPPCEHRRSPRGDRGTERAADPSRMPRSGVRIESRHRDES